MCSRWALINPIQLIREWRKGIPVKGIPKNFRIGRRNESIRIDSKLCNSTHHWPRNNKKKVEELQRTLKMRIQSSFISNVKEAPKNPELEREKTTELQILLEKNGTKWVRKINKECVRKMELAYHPMKETYTKKLLSYD